MKRVKHDMVILFALCYLNYMCNEIAVVLGNYIFAKSVGLTSWHAIQLAFYVLKHT